MVNMQPPTMSNTNVLTPVNPAIENYMRLLVGRTDHTILTEMETLAKKKVIVTKVLLRHQEKIHLLKQ